MRDDRAKPGPPRRSVARRAQSARAALSTRFSQPITSRVHKQQSAAGGSLATQHQARARGAGNERAVRIDDVAFDETDVATAFHHARVRRQMRAARPASAKRLCS
jgi:hypothetical protein